MRVIVLNLKSRTDRLAEVTDELHKWGISNFDVFEAIPDRYMGLNRSMLAITKQIAAGTEETLVFEDDVQFVGTMQQFTEAKSQLPPDFNLMYLGANVLSICPRYSRNLNILKKGWTTHAVLYSVAGARWIADHYKLETVYDDWLMRIGQRKLRAYIMNPMIAIQRPGYSDLNHKFEDYNFLLATQRHFL